MVLGSARRAPDEERFHEELLDVVAVLERLGPTCTDLGELCALIRLATGDGESLPNLAQRRILMALLAAPDEQQRNAARHGRSPEGPQRQG